ncbi:hypothetical protein SAMN05892877_1072 [Rhizobium subbaraonis]|uniref:Uncharacterized protein n=1 Tax=Rhizobium subbaraonis TaxID=908946 RepID=A0A285UFC7_9HYPH|nr:hypothetical protein [Rhizobium subbaraonis]SOC40098.1 hypothetical protein SAMN05892877_1072 [Rhizobium subbaraonis]
MSEKFPIQAISDVSDPETIRVVIFINGEFVHVPLSALLKALRQDLTALEGRVEDLETP